MRTVLTRFNNIISLKSRAYYGYACPTKLVKDLQKGDQFMGSAVKLNKIYNKNYEVYKNNKKYRDDINNPKCLTTFGFNVYNAYSKLAGKFILSPTTELQHYDLSTVGFNVYNDCLNSRIMPLADELSMFPCTNLIIDKGSAVYGLNPLILVEDHARLGLQLTSKMYSRNMKITIMMELYLRY
jgi:hypothetical protein